MSALRLASRGIFEIPQHRPSLGAVSGLGSKVLLQQVAVADSVVIHQQQIFADGMGDAVASGSARSGICLAQVLEPEGRMIILQRFLSSVRRAIVNDNHLEVIGRKGLCLKRGEAFF